MIKNQRKMMRTTTRRNPHSQWRQKQPKTTECQSKGEIFQRTYQRKYRSRGGIKNKEMKDLEKIMFSAEEPPPGFKVVSNHLIFKNIMAQMTVPTLQIARLVCREWKKLANLELWRRKCARMSFTSDWSDSKLKILRNLVDISWMEFDLKYLDAEDLESFVTRFGHQVKILKLQPSNSSSSSFSFFGFRRSKWARIWDFIAAGKFPNLEILVFHKGFSYRDEYDWYGFSGIHNRRRYRPHQKLLQWSSNTDKSLSNLQGIEGIHLSDVSRFPPQFLERKGHLIKCAKLDIRHRDDIGSTALNDITQLAQAQPNLERLVIEKILQDHYPEFAKHIDLLLESSRESLRFLKISLFFDSPFCFQPQLVHNQPYSKLSTLHFHMDISGANLKKQLESLNQDCLPNLKTVKIKVGFWTEFPEPLYFSPGTRGRGQLTSVVNLELICKHQRSPFRDLHPSFWFPWLSTCFPNIRSLTTEIWRDNHEVLQHVFTLWPKLTSLSIRFCYDPTTTAKSNLDPVFTGLSTRNCKHLQKYPENMTNEILTDRICPNLSILKELKRLDLIVTGRISLPFWCPLSLVSFLCAINLHPELKTTIRFLEKEHDYRKFLEPLAAYAKLKGFTGTHWKF